MELKNLRLTSRPGAWRMFMGRKSDKAFRGFQQRVFERDQFTCQFCGFQARQYQEVINIDNDYTNNKIDNVVTACCFCSQCFFIESVDVGGYGGGTLILLPEIQQAELNAFCHVMFCAIANGTAYKETSQKIYRSLKFRAQAIEQHYGDGASRPSVLAQLMLAQQECDQTYMSHLLGDIRLLPAQAKFAKQIEAWAEAALQEVPRE